MAQEEHGVQINLKLPISLLRGSCDVKTISSVAVCGKQVIFMANYYVEDNLISSAIVHYLSAAGAPDTGATSLSGEYCADRSSTPRSFL